jgi:hypothetical protein
MRAEPSLLEEAIGATTVVLGAIERNIGVLQELLWRGAVMRRESYADAGANHHLMLLYFERSAQGFDDACASDVASSGWVAAHCRITNSSPPMRAMVSVSRTQFRNRPVTAFSNVSSKLSANRSTRDCVALKSMPSATSPSGIETKRKSGERLLQALGQQYAIGQFGERIMVRHVGARRDGSRAVP